ncbi:unnamed protein product [Caenorhabditis auriculariae]|uniref:Solute carrier family 23 member 1 n=1 Tax=Caenorhabditis auriculariae TaxID=2777116 RepID=A0A8S1HQ97_9PELO|nr:unnamed protein product [Caenorhabditis auriculariae]
MEKDEKKQRKFLRAKDTPPPAVALLYGLQQVMVCVSALLTVPLIMSDALCAGSNIARLRQTLISSTFVSSGLSTIVQTLFGMRLALLQGTAFAYVPSVQGFFNLPENRCNATEQDFVSTEEYYTRIALIQGCLILSSFVPMLIGFTGLVGLLTKFIGPLTVSPLMLLLAFSQTDLMVTHISKHWVAVVQAVTLFATILYLADVNVPLPGWKEGKLHWYRTNLFGQYPYLIAILVSWTFCVVLTVFDLVPEGSSARVDKNISLQVIRESSWVELPYPGKFGPPQFNTSLFLLFLLSAMTSVFESVGDYHAAARVSQERPPPSHAINRGILSEGLGSLISGLLGPGVGMTTHTENIGVIGVTRVASRWTMVVAGLLLIVLGILTKIGAVLSTIPDPLVGGVLASSMAMVVGVAVSNLQTVDMTMSRNMGILGFSMMFGLIVPKYFTLNPVASGWQWLNQVLNVLLQMPMFVGAMCACILDNSVGGATREQRGLRARGEVYAGNLDECTYSYPPLVMKVLNKIPLVKYLPCMPKDKKPTNRVEPEMLVVGNHDIKFPSRHTQGRICHSSQFTIITYQDRTSANRLGTPLKRYKGIG